MTATDREPIDPDTGQPVQPDTSPSEGEALPETTDAQDRPVENPSGG